MRKKKPFNIRRLGLGGFGLTLISIAFRSSLAVAPPPPTPRTIMSLDGDAWKLAGLEPGEGQKLGINSQLSNKTKFIPTSVPNDVQLAIGLKDPEGQGADIVDINRREWWYVRTFLSPRIGVEQQVRLVFEGVDYFADAWLNGTELGSHEGAYTQFSFDVTKLLRREGNNYLAVRVTAPWQVPGRSHYEFMKGEYDETWDALPGPGQVVFPLGLHRSVLLEVTSTTRVEELQIWTASLARDRATLKCEVLVSNLRGIRRGTLQVMIRPENFPGPSLNLPPRAFTFTGESGGQQEIEFTAEVERPKLWWTWDQGPQNLYIAQATLADPQGTVLDSTSATFGIRTLERDANLVYKLNGRPIFLRGAWYPMSKLYPASTNRWTYEKDLLLARNANMNHLVNYTVVEKSAFYDLADRLGILLFVELPFNQEGPIDALNAHYPHRAEFIRWSARQVAQIVRALANHPSIGVWSAVSEVTDNGQDFTTSSDFRIAAAADGYDLFIRNMQEVVKANDPDALYFRSYCDFGEHHFWEGAFLSGTTYDQQYDAQAHFVSEYGALAFFPLEDMRRVVDPDGLWDPKARRWSSLALPVDLKRMSYVHGWQYFGLDFLTADIAANVDRYVRSFRDYAEDSQVYQAFLYGYAADAYRRKIFAPINGIRSWMFKSFPEKPVSGFGVIDSFDTPMVGYYEQKRTYAPVVMSYAVRYMLESVPAGSAWHVPVWISNATNDELSLSVESALFSLEGQRVRDAEKQVVVPARQAQDVFDLDWRLPEEPGVYLLRGRATRGAEETARAEMYVKVVPGATAKRLRALVFGTPEWAQPVVDYLTNLGADVTPVIKQPTVLQQPSHPFPESAERLRRDYDLIWLTGFDDYWREAPEHWTKTIVEAVKSGVTFVHTGSWGSFHGGGERTAALDLTPLAQVLPVAVEHENDLFVKNTFQVDHEPNQPPDSSPRPQVTVTADAPGWLKEVDFTGLAPDSYHMLEARAGATVILSLDGHPLLVAGHYGKGRTLAYLGFSPEGSEKLDGQPVMIDRAIRSSPAGRLFTIVSAALMALASGEAPTTSLRDLIETRATPLYETLRDHSTEVWPTVSVSWTRSPRGAVARVHVKNGSGYLRGLRLRLDGPDFRSGRALALWSGQYFDLLPGEQAECEVELITADGKPLRAVSLAAETLSRPTAKEYQIPSPPR